MGVAKVESWGGGAKQGCTRETKHLYEDKTNIGERLFLRNYTKGNGGPGVFLPNNL